MIYAIYNISNGEIRQSIDIPEFLVNTIALNEGEALAEIPRMAHDATEFINDGRLTPKTDTNTAD